jgi:hypothetical protein
MVDDPVERGQMVDDPVERSPGNKIKLAEIKIIYNTYDSSISLFESTMVGPLGKSLG